MGDCVFSLTYVNAVLMWIGRQTKKANKIIKNPNFQSYFKLEDTLRPSL